MTLPAADLARRWEQTAERRLERVKHLTKVIETFCIERYEVKGLTPEYWYEMCLGCAGFYRRSPAWAMYLKEHGKLVGNTYAEASHDFDCKVFDKDGRVR